MRRLRHERGPCALGHLGAEARDEGAAELLARVLLAALGPVLAEPARVPRTLDHLNIHPPFNIGCGPRVRRARFELQEKFTFM